MHLKDVTDVLIGKRPRDSTILKPANGAYGSGFSVRTIGGSRAGMWVMRVVRVVCDRASHTSRVRSCVGRAGRMRSCAEGRKSNPSSMPKNQSLVYPIGVFFRYISCYYNEVTLD